MKKALLALSLLLLLCCGMALAESADITFSFSHIGINNYDDEAQDALRDFFENALRFADTREIAVSHYVADDKVELLKGTNYGEYCHIGIYTADIAAAIRYLEGLGYSFDYDTVKYQDDGVTMRLIYLKDVINGVGFHLTTSK